MEELLLQSGLDENEAKIYTTLLELGPSSVSEITKKAGLNRTLGYHVLGRLYGHGLVYEGASRGKKIIYSAEHPQALLRMVKNNKQKWEGALTKLEQKLPEFVSLYKIAEKPSVKYKDGPAGVIDIYYESLDAQGEFLCFWDYDAWVQSGLLSKGVEYFKERNRRKKKARVLVLDTPQSRQWVKSQRFNLIHTQYRWAKPENLPGIKDFGGELNIYDNKLNVIVLKKPQFGVILESKVLANLMRAMFEMAWQIGEPVVTKNLRK
ncbi:MAG: helix-turn-helix domain-containing protein [Candidatus Magasanikbacteria bacterium]